MTSEDLNCCLCPFQGSSEQGLNIHIEFNHSEIFDPHYQQPEDDYQGPPESMKNENEPEEEQPGPPIKTENCDVETNSVLDPQRSFFLNWVSPIQQKDKEQEQILLKQLRQEPIKLECPQCSRPFKDKYGLEKHVKFFHSDETPHHCADCSKTFKQVGHLNVHIKFVHQKLRPFPCSYCTKPFVSKYKLEEHIKVVHEKLKPHQCQDCPKAFGKRYALTSHVNYLHKKT